MASLNKESADARLTFTGTFGNLSVGELMEFQAAGAAIGDKVYLGIVEPGSTVVAFDLYRTALGAGVTLTVGYEPRDPDSLLTADPDYWANAVAASAAGWIRSDAAPIHFEEGVYIIATIAGGAATGLVQALPKYIYRNVG